MSARTQFERPWAPTAVLVLGIVVVAAVVAAFNARIGGLILDEATIKQSAVHYTSGLPGSLFHDVNARATSRLYSLLLAPLVAWLPGDEAVRVGRALNGLLFASAAVPLYLLARHAVRSKWLAVLAALAGITLPWLVLTTALFTENLAYPLVAWAVLAMVAAFARPAAWRDLLALAAIGLCTVTRTQLVALLGAYVVLVLWRLWLERPRAGQSFSGFAGRSLRSFPLTAAVLALGLAGLLVKAEHGTLGTWLRSVLGGYAATTSDRGTAPADVGTATAIEALALALGVGLVPALLGLTWYPQALRRPASGGPFAVAAGTAVAMIALWAATLYSQGGYLGPATEERYFMYAAPFLWVAAVAAWEGRTVRPRAVLEIGGALALVALVLQLPRTFAEDGSFFAPAMADGSYVAGRLSRLAGDLGVPGLSEPDILGVAVVAIVLGVAALCRWAPRRGVAIAIGVGVGLQLIATGLAFAAIDGKIAGVPGRVVGGGFSGLGFIDRHAGGLPVLWVGNHPSPPDGSADNIQRTALLYNDQIRTRVQVPSVGVVPDNFPLNAIPPAIMEPAPATGRLPFSGVGPARHLAVQTASSPFLQLQGDVLARSPAWMNLELIDLAVPIRATWATSGLAATGLVMPGQPVHFTLWERARVTLHLVAQAQPAIVSVRTRGGSRQVAPLPRAAGTATTVVDGCRARRTRGVITATQPVAIASVAVDQSACAS